MFVFDGGSMIAYATAAAALYLVFCIFLRPIHLIFKLIFSGFFGLILLFIVNAIGKFSGIFIAINIFTTLIAGLLGVPGILLLLAINLIL